MNLEITQSAKCETFVSMFQHIKQFTEFANILFEESRMYLQCMDSAHIMIFEIILPNTWFDVYQLKENTIIGLNTGILAKVLSTREKNQSIQINTRIEDMLCFDFACSESNVSHQVFDKHFEIPLLDIEAEQLEIPEIDHQAEFVLPSITFANLIHQLKQFGDTLEFFCSEEKISMSSRSLELGKMSVQLSIDDLQEFAIEEDEQLILSFSLKYMHDICLYQKLTKLISIGISRNYPMKVSYQMMDDACMNFYLAPKIEEE